MFIHCECFQRAAATEKYHLSIEEMLHNERQAELRQAEDEQRLTEEGTHKVGNIHKFSLYKNFVILRI
jgi:hypothetical protein